MYKELINDINNQLTGSSAEEIIRTCAENFKDKLVFASSLGLEDQAITHIIASNNFPVSIFTLDTGRLFYESYDLIEKTESKYKIKINIFSPNTNKLQELVNEKGINMFYYSIENRKACCEVRKIEPLQRALKGNNAWICGLRREQSVTRKDLDIIEWDENNGLIKVNPLLNWTENQLNDYIKTNKIPYNTLHDNGFPSIGCAPCTRAIAEGEDIRAGRWWWESPETKECGLHKRG
ncbi:MAG: phosphoadenylyl-sulfate reductase [Bacteroidota bacterium]